MRLFEYLRALITLRVIVGVVMLATLLFGMTLLALWVVRSGPAEPMQSTAVLQVIPLPSSTPVLPTPTLAESTPSQEVPPSPPPGVIGVGAFVQISGTGGDGLRMRNRPGLEGEVLFLGLESEVFRVVDGPQSADGYTWWFLEAPFDESVRGWAVANFLVLVQNP
ncbi:MAG: hypothetical protein JSV61_03540 [Anaerolineales bacterium]|nr:MAG: hypothetical protein JSV61_03540 [Anaerolineales bacterium]